VCPDFVGPGRLVGQLRAVVLRFWDTPGRLGPIGGLPGGAGRDPFRPLAAPSCALRLRSGEGVPMATAIISGGRAFRTATPVFSIPPWSRLKPLLPIEIGLLRHSRARRRPSPTQKAPSRSAQADRWPKAPGGRIHSARRPTADRRPSRRLKSAFQGAARRASAFADAKGTSRRRRPTADRRPSRRLKSAFQGAARQASASADAEDTLPGRRRPTVGRRPLEAECIRRTCRPPAEGFHAD
jgi:hypothetical protein